MTMQELEILAPAKVNLFLAVLGKRGDGYHDIATVMQKINLYDQLHLRKEGPGISLSCPNSGLPEDSSNLAWKAARLFFDQTSIKDTVRITLHKKIPVAAGLGGGSSDAAAILLGLNSLYATGLTEDSLRAMAATLGADVPFFVADMATALATGTGTDLLPRKWPHDYCLVLVNPGLAVSTRWVYENLILTADGNHYRLCGYSHPAEYAEHLLEAFFYPGSCAHPLFNDLESVTVGKHPVIATIKEKLLDDGALFSLMSGSGPTVFGVFRQSDLAEKSCRKFRQLYKDVFLVNPLQE